MESICIYKPCTYIPLASSYVCGLKLIIPMLVAFHIISDESMMTF